MAIAALHSTEFNSYIRGYHAYKEDWAPTTGEELVLRRELENDKDHYAVAVVKDGEIVGHVPYMQLIQNSISLFEKDLQYRVC